MACNENHSALSHIMANLPNDQGGGLGVTNVQLVLIKKDLKLGII